MKKRLLPIALMAVLVLGGCAQNDNTGGGDGGGEQIVAPVLSKVEITNRADLQAEWHLNDLAKPTKSVQIACTPENNPDLLIHQGSMTVTSSDTNVITVKGRKLTPKAVGKSTITVTFKNTAENITLTDSVEITILEEKDSVVPLKEIRQGIAKGELEEDDVFKTYGKIVGHFDTSEGKHIKKGVFIQDGAYGAALSYGQIEDVWKKPDSFKIGDEIYIEGKIDEYMGMYNLNPTTFRLLTAEDNKTIADPVPLELTAANYNATALKEYQGTLFSIKGLKYVDGDVETLTNHNVIKFELPTAEGGIAVNLGLNYHIGQGELTKIKKAISTMDKDMSTIDIVGTISWSGAEPELSVAYLDGKTPAECITVKDPKAAPTAITIEGPTEVKATEKIELTIKTTPEKASKGVVWSVAPAGDAETAGEAKIDINGNLKGIAEGDVVVTAKSTLDETVVDTHNVKVLPAPAANGPTMVDTFDNGGTYKLGFHHLNEGVDADLFFKDTITSDKKYLETTRTYDEAANFVITKDGEGYTIMNGANYLGVGSEEYTGSNGDKYTMKVPTLTTTKFVWGWNADKATFTYTETYKDSEDVQHTKTYILGTRNDKKFETVGLNGFEGDKYKDYSYAKVVDYLITPEMVNAPVEGDYIYGLNQETIGKQLYMTGELDDRFLKTTTKISQAQIITVAKTVESKYTLSFKVGEATKYIGITEYEYESRGQTKIGAKIILSDTIYEWNWDAEHLVFTAKGELGGTYYIGSYSSYDTLSTSSIDKISGDGSFHASLYKVSANVPTATGIVLTSSKESIEQGETLTLDVKVYPASAEPTIEWTSDKPEIATVENGVVAGQLPGTAKITAKIGTLTKTVEITVKGISEMVLNDENLGPKGYSSDNTAKIAGTTFVAHQIYVGTGKNYAGMQLKKAAASGNKSAVDSTIYNTTATSKAIKSIELTAYTGKAIKDLDIYFGTESCAELTTGATTLASGTLTIDAPEGMTFFKIAAKVSSTSYIASIKITFVE